MKFRQQAAGSRQQAADSRQPSLLSAACCLLSAVLLFQCHHEDATTANGGNRDRGKQLVAQYACTACHDIPGVKGPRGMVGPPLSGVGTRSMIAGKLPNTPQNLEHWILNPQAVDPNNAMPNLNVTPQDARDIAAFLYTLR